MNNKLTGFTIIPNYVNKFTFFFHKYFFNNFLSKGCCLKKEK